MTDHGPLQYAAGYSLDLYCRLGNPSGGRVGHEDTFFGRTFGECAKQARATGWVIHRDRTATCPKCKRTKTGVTVRQIEGKAV